MSDLCETCEWAWWHDVLPTDPIDGLNHHGHCRAEPGQVIGWITQETGWECSTRHITRQVVWGLPEIRRDGRCRHHKQLERSE